MGENRNRRDGEVQSFRSDGGQELKDRNMDPEGRTRPGCLPGQAALVPPTPRTTRLALPELQVQRRKRGGTGGEKPGERGGGRSREKRGQQDGEVNTKKHFDRKLLSCSFSERGRIPRWKVSFQAKPKGMRAGALGSGSILHKTSSSSADTPPAPLSSPAPAKPKE